VLDSVHVSAQHIASALMYGVPAACPACDNAALSMCPALDELYCDGNLGGYTRCTYHTKVSTRREGEREASA